jgi:hypothetical protein
VPRDVLEVLNSPMVQQGTTRDNLSCVAVFSGLLYDVFTSSEGVKNGKHRKAHQ